jgi:hypothetical protein
MLMVLLMLFQNVQALELSSATQPVEWSFLPGKQSSMRGMQRRSKQWRVEKDYSWVSVVQKEGHP